MSKNKRNFLLEMIEGPRTYVPPANTMIVELQDQAKTRGGIMIPDNVEGPAGIRPLGKVLFL